MPGGRDLNKCQIPAYLGLNSCQMPGGYPGGMGTLGFDAYINCKADRLSGVCTSRAKMSAIRTRHDKTTLLVTKGDNGHFRTLRAITYKKILNKLNAISNFLICCMSASACDFWFGMPGVRM